MEAVAKSGSGEQSYMGGRQCETGSRITPYNPYNTKISKSTRKFIGWGDHDYDGRLDPIDYIP